MTKIFFFVHDAKLYKRHLVNELILSTFFHRIKKSFLKKNDFNQTTRKTISTFSTYFLMSVAFIEFELLYVHLLMLFQIIIINPETPTWGPRGPQLVSF